ncbi:HMG box-containing protein C19G7.04 [Cladobotryum mycophilum]|uniref:HMG box-containing protein C19G7.04 n=1 Tax=Cladobotryum mycophilum TaxID=491253 RepID=A0ABR0SMZ1_9HYPO
MARLVEHNPCSDDELPELDVLLKQPTGEQEKINKPPVSQSRKKKDTTSVSTTAKRRVRRLEGEIRDAPNLLFLPWNAEETSTGTSDILRRRLSPSLLDLPQEPSRTKKRPMISKQPSSEYEDPASETYQATKPRIELRQEHDSARRTPRPSQLRSEESPALRLGHLHTSKRATKVESGIRKNEYMEHAVKNRRAAKSKQKPTSNSDIEDNDEDGADESSEYDNNDKSDSSSDSLYETPEEYSPQPVSRISKKTSKSQNKESSDQDDAVSAPRRSSRKCRETNPDTKTAQKDPFTSFRETLGEQQPKCSNGTPESSDLADSLSKLRLQFEEDSDEYHTPVESKSFKAPYLTPPRKSKSNGLASPRKRAYIPKTPHRPSVDTFWSQEFVDDWNEQHSPRKPSRADTSVQKPPKNNPKKETKKSFAARKGQVAQDFLSQLDNRITHGKIAQLAASTGGVKIVWSKTLNTTAGRANWRRETIRTKQGGVDPQITVEHKHHASIELAEKVIDEEDRLLNVLAHEFCHLANFMINGITTNPHGKEFKVWAAKCSQEFAAQGIKVTTKHTYEIDFKYIWTCSACQAQYKRHSKSIDPSRHRCGTCKGTLTQTKPVPRGAGAGGKPSEYQIFMKEQMKIVRSENPGSPQKEVMKIIADRWSKRGRVKENQQVTKGSSSVLAQLVVDLSLEDGLDV